MQYFKGFLIVLALILTLAGIGQSQARSLSIYRIPPILTKRDKELTAINQADKIKFANFLDEDRTGIVRLHDAANCSVKSSVINANEPCPWNIPGKATAYSFRKENYRSSFFSDIALVESNFQIVGINMLGFLTELGDVALDNLSLQSRGIKEMSEFEPSTNLNEIEKQLANTEKGFRVGEFLYANLLPMKENATYALRCIAYKAKIYRKINGFKVNVLDGDKRIDITLAFRVIRKHEDGSVSILWKALNKKDSPEIIYNNQKKN